jgi:VanZ family protein
LSLLSLWLPVIAYMAMLFYLSSLSTLPAPPGKISYEGVHVLAYAGLAVVTARALARGRWRHVTARIVAGAVAISTAYGLSDEYHQSFVAGRDASAIDLLADAIGSILGTGLLWAWGIIRRRPETRDAL